MSAALPIDPATETRFPDWSFVWPWLLGFVLTVFLGLSGGGYDPLVSGQAGIAIWWLLLLAVAAGAIPRRRPGTLAYWALGLLAAFVLWTALGLSWTESVEKTAADLAQVCSFLGIFALGLLTRDRDGARYTVSAVAAGIFVVALVALLSRLHPAWFPEAIETGRFLETGRERLSYPLDYWNGLAALISIGLPLMLQVACNARWLLVRALAAAALPAMMLALFLTLSRGGIAGGAIALAVYLAFAYDRIPKLLTLLVTGTGGIALALLANSRYELVHGFTGPAARSQGDEMIWLTLVVCLLAGFFQAGLTSVRLPAWLTITRRQSQIALAAAGVVLLVGLVAVNAPGRVGDAWDDFKAPSNQSESGTSRLGSIGGENRYQLWSSAVREFDTDPLQGTGSGTFQLWWTRDGDIPTPILDAHSLYFQTLGELGITGLLLLLAFMVTALVGGAVLLLRAAGEARAWLAAALAASTVVWTTSIFDWAWELPIIPIVTLLLLALVLGGEDNEVPAERPGLRWPLRLGVVAVSILALVAIAIPLASNTLIRQSQEDARAGDVAGALSDARSAQNAQPDAATPRLQEALLLEGLGDYEEAEAAALAATERESTNWRNWLVLSRIQAQNQHPAAALRSYREARKLNPGSRLFASV